MKSTKYVAAFVLLIAIPQIAAFSFQFILGFRPFLAEPVRVPLSWDMFANRLERCTVKWSPPITIGPHTLSSLRDVELPFEWDIIFDQAEAYRAISGGLCRDFARGPAQVQLHCFFPDGKETRDEFACRP